MVSIKNHQDKVLDSITSSLEAMTRMVELAKSSGIYDDGIAESAFLCIEAGLKLSLSPQSPPSLKLTDEQKQSTRAFLNDCNQFFGTTSKALYW